MDIRPHASAVFCDDLRQEVTGKMLHIGVYNDEILFNVPPPWTLSGLWCIITYFEEAPAVVPAIDFKATLTTADGVLELFRYTQTLTGDEMVVQEPHKFETDSKPVLTLRAFYYLSPMSLAGPAKIGVTAVRNGEEIFAGRVRVSEMPATPVASAT